MKILTGSKIAEADRYTIEHEPIESLALMERASEVIAQWICQHIAQDTPLLFVIGKGNNGGDGLAVARMLHRVDFRCEIALIFDKKQLSAECRYNLDRLPKGVKVRRWEEVEFAPETVIVDALLGTGVSGAIVGPVAGVIEGINRSECRVLSIDVPSGMLTEYGNVADRPMVRADVTLTLEFPKLALLLPEAGECAGEIVVLPISLDPDFITQTDTPYYYLSEEAVRSLILSRSRFGHKGKFGHALLVCGSEGMAGAAVLATGAALRSGCGLVTVHLPRDERFAMHATNPSAMVSCDSRSCFSQLPADMERYTAVGVGPGVGQNPLSVDALEQLLSCGKPMVIDADALNILAVRTDLQALIPAGSVLTPHPGELQRLVGAWESDADRNVLVRALAARCGVCVVVKGAHTMICTPQGDCYFNSTGNAGMAKGGSGDVLTGLITGLQARGYDAPSAAMIGVYLHGMAGDKAAGYFGQEGMNAGDLVDFIGEAGAELFATSGENQL